MDSVLNITTSILGQRWAWRGLAADARDPGFAPDDLVTQLLLSRGCPREELDAHRAPSIRGFMPDPSIFRDMDRAAARLADAIRAGETITVRFSGIEGGLRAHGGPYALGVELCGETQESCRYVLPALQGDAMLIAADGQAVTRVRHAWSDAPIVNLYDGRGLPVPGFELKVER